MNEVTLILSALERGDPQAADKLLPLVYDELRKLATARLAHESPNQTLQATALVHEAYLRLVETDQNAPTWNGRGHFFAAAGEAMRRILVESARRKQRLKHGGDHTRADLGDIACFTNEPREDLLDLDAALTKLKAVDPQAAELVHLRYFAGLTLSAAADVLGIPDRSADRTWAYTKAWLQREIQFAHFAKKS